MTGVRDILQPGVHAVPTDMDREEMAEIVRRYDLVSVPVVEPATGGVVGIITLACHAIGVAPALASGPFVTSLNDITGTLISLGLGGGLLRALG